MPGDRRVSIRRSAVIGSVWVALALTSAPSEAAVACKLIRNVAQLQAIQNDLDGSYCLANDIEASGVANFAPLGTSASPFTGRLYGNNHVIANLTVSSAAAGVGLFGVTDGAVIQDLALLNAKVTGPDNAYIGALVGIAKGSSAPSTIARVSVTGQVKSAGASSLGGIAGNLNANVTLTQSRSAAKVVGPAPATQAGGLVACNDGGTVQQSYATGPVTGGDDSQVGGLIACNRGGATLLSYAAGPVTGGADSEVGGLVGYQSGGKITESYAVGKVGGGAESSVGGLIGSVFGSPIVMNAYWDTQTSGQTASGGGLGGGLMTTQFRAELPPGFGNAWAITRKLSYPFLNDPHIDFASPLATLVRSSKVFVFLPIGQLDKSQYKTEPVHADKASLATVYTMIARAIGITKDIAALRNVTISRYWDDASQTAHWDGEITAHASLGALRTIAGNARLDGSNVIGQMDRQRLVILRGSYKKSGGGTATHFMLGTLYTKAGGAVQAVVAHDPWTGEQVSIDRATKKVISPANFPLANFKVNGYRRVTIN